MNAKPLPTNPYNPLSWITGTPKIGKGTWIGAFCLIDGLGGLTIGAGCDISCGAHIVTHSTAKRCVSGRKYPLIDKAPTKIGKCVFIGENATVLMGCDIGHHSIVAAGTVIKERTVIPPYSLVAGVPGRIVKNLKKTVAELRNYDGRTAKRKK